MAVAEMYIKGESTINFEFLLRVSAGRRWQRGKGVWGKGEREEEAISKHRMPQQSGKMLKAVRERGQATTATCQQSRNHELGADLQKEHLHCLKVCGEGEMRKSKMLGCATWKSGLVLNLLRVIPFLLPHH